MAPRVNVICRNLNDDRVLPRFARYLRDGLGWTLTAAPQAPADVVYLMGYFETQVCPTWPAVPVVCYFTHREEEPPGNAKAALFDEVAKRVQLRVAMCRLYAESLSRYGATVQPPLPVERDRFTIPKTRNTRLVAGFSGYTYKNCRKGEDLVRAILGSKVGRSLEWRASGRGWPVSMKGYPWADMPKFYQGLDILVCTSRVEGGPMPPLEALSCGVSVVIPRGVGILDELPDLPGIHRYARGDAGDLVKALGAAIVGRGKVDRGALRAVTEPYTVEAFCREHAVAMEQMSSQDLDAGIAAEATEGIEVRQIQVVAPVERHTNSSRGIYVVAFGDPARKCALKMMQTAKRHMPDVPICLCAAKRIGPEDVLVKEPDSDVGGRRAKLRAYELAPAEWQSVLYLDADIEIIAPVYRFFEWAEAGWEFIICRDVGETLHSFQRKNNLAELHQLEAVIGTLHALQYNGGVWAFQRCAAAKGFFERWRREWEVHAQRDQGALIRALHAQPLKLLVLGNEWNCFPKYTPQVTSAGILHFPGDARRWEGKLPGRIDGPAAWQIVRKWEQMHQ